MKGQPVILVSPDRVLHICRLGSRLGRRVIGALVTYIGLEEDILVDIEEEGTVRGRVVTVAPFKSHRIIAGKQFVKTILVEPETVSEACLVYLKDKFSVLTYTEASALGLLEPISIPAGLALHVSERFSTEHFDQTFFKMTLTPRTLDRRVKMARTMIERSAGRNLLTSDCAAALAISSSRFRRLFSNSTGIQFRRYRMWKRARAYLEYVMTPASLTQTALELGYPDSTHFSHSIRSTYGLPPRKMKTLMEDSVFLSPQTLDINEHSPLPR